VGFNLEQQVAHDLGVFASSGAPKVGEPSARPCPIAVFLERGVSRATLDEIARAAGVTRGAIYWHFRDKLEIFVALER
jgi:hypothetical protein